MIWGQNFTPNAEYTLIPRCVKSGNVLRRHFLDIREKPGEGRVPQGVGLGPSGYLRTPKRPDNVMLTS